jgi:hypothetical protein
MLAHNTTDLSLSHLIGFFGDGIGDKEMMKLEGRPTLSWHPKKMEEIWGCGQVVMVIDLWLT